LQDDLACWAEINLNYEYIYYHLPTAFEYVGLHSEFGKNFILDIKTYTYNYDNSEVHERGSDYRSTTLNGVAVQPGDVEESEEAHLTKPTSAGEFGEENFDYVSTIGATALYLPVLL
jgi:hypothetical protein